MRILAVVPEWDASGGSGGHFTNRATLMELGQRAEVEVLAVCDSPDTAPGVDGPLRITPIQRAPPSIRRKLFGPDPALAMWARGVGAPDRIAALLRDRHVDAVVVGPTYSGVNLPSTLDVPLVVLTQNVECVRLTVLARQSGSLVRRAWALIQRARMRDLERRVLSRASAVFALSERDVPRLRGLAGPGRRVVRLPVVPDQTLLALPVQRSGVMVLFVGSLSYPPNVAAAMILATRVMPGVRVRHPSASLLIAGSHPPQSVRDLHCERNGIVVLPDFENQSDVYARATVFAAPIAEQEGVSVKVVHAFASGTPVVATPALLAGVGAEPGIHARSAISDADFVREISALLSSPHECIRLATAAREFVNREYSPTALRAALVEAFGT